MAAAQQLEAMNKLERGNDIRQMISSSENGRAFKLLMKRENNRLRAAAEKDNIENETNKRKRGSIDQMFGASKVDALEEEFKTQTVGLVSVEEFKRKREAIDEMIKQSDRAKLEQKKLNVKRHLATSKLSFDDDIDPSSSSGSDDDDDKAPFRKGFGKDPMANTAFLYDAERDFENKQQRAKLVSEYMVEQDAQKKERLEVTYSYWDGSGHRRSTQVEKGFSVGQFLAKTKGELEKTDFPELRSVAVDNLMFVKEDTIIPPNITFYELIRDQVQGKAGGALFDFRVMEAIRTRTDIRKETQESHAGKIVDRKWYERNKHIFPACRWELYDKNKAFDGSAARGMNADSSQFRQSVQPSRANRDNDQVAEAKDNPLVAS